MTEAKLEPLATREHVFNTETRLLEEFRKWASPSDMRTRSNALRTSAIEADLDLVKDRLDKLEGRQ